MQLATIPHTHQTTPRATSAASADQHSTHILQGCLPPFSMHVHISSPTIQCTCTETCNQPTRAVQDNRDPCHTENLHHHCILALPRRRSRLIWLTRPIQAHTFSTSTTQGQALIQVPCPLPLPPAKTCIQTQLARARDQTHKGLNRGPWHAAGLRHLLLVLR